MYVPYSKQGSMKIRGIIIRFFVCITIIALTCPAYAQSWKDLKDRSIEFYEAGKNDSAIFYGKLAMQVTIQSFGKNSTVYGDDLIRLAGFYQGKGDYVNAEASLLEAVSVYKIAMGADNRYYAITLNTLAAFYTSIKKFDKAEALYTQSLAIVKNAMGDDHPEYANTVSGMAEMYEPMGNNAKAEILFIEALAIRKKALGTDHPDYTSSLYDLGSLYYSERAYVKAEPIFAELLAIIKKNFGVASQQYVLALNNLGMVDEFTGNNTNAEQLYLEAIDICKKGNKTQHPLYVSSVYNLGHVLMSMGEYSKAIPFCEEALSLQRTLLGTENADYANTVNMLALLYQHTGNNAKAELLYVEALSIRKNLFGPESDSYAEFLNNLSFLYTAMGNYAKAMPLSIESLAICKKVPGTEHPHYAIALNSLAFLYKSQGDYANAEKLYLESLALRQKLFGSENAEYASCLNNLAALYVDMGEQGKAEPMFISALAIRKKVLGVEHPDYGTSLNNLARFYQIKGSYTKAEPLYSEALENTKKSLGMAHPDYAQSLNNLGTLYSEMGNYEKAEPLFIEGKKVTLQNISKNFSFLSEQEKERYMQTVTADFEYYHSFLMQYQRLKPSVSAEAYNIELATKGMILSSGIQLKQAIISSGNPEAIATFDKWNGLKTILAHLYSIPVAQRKLNIDSIENLANDCEKKLSRLSTSFRQGELLAQADWKSVQQALGPNEVSIEFASFRFYNHTRRTDTTQYIAIVLRKRDAYPSIIKLCRQTQLDTLLNRSGNTNSSFISGLYRGGHTLSSGISNAERRQLYKLIWRPLDSLLRPGDHIYYSPSGSLHQVAFAAIPVNGDTLLSDRYQLTQLNSTAALLQPVLVLDKKDLSIAAFGGIKYDASVTELLDSAPKANQLIASRSLPDGSRGSTWTYLPGTLNEINSIDSLTKAFHVPATIYRGTSASEETYKNNRLGRSPAIIHIATHGFFFPDPEKENKGIETLTDDKQEFRTSVNPLNRSGLLFAGANHIWRGESLPAGLEDGILTAYEASNVTLSNTQLVVLSACETGLGDIKGSEGVFGLQRAFKAAGANYLMMSLWKVPDSETAEFMKEFYQSLFSGRSIEQAFSLSQTVMKNKYRKDPYKWAAFVLVR